MCRSSSPSHAGRVSLASSGFTTSKGESEKPSSSSSLSMSSSLSSLRDRFRNWALGILNPAGIGSRITVVVSRLRSNGAPSQCLRRWKHSSASTDESRRKRKRTGTPGALSGRSRGLIAQGPRTMMTCGSRGDRAMLASPPSIFTISNLRAPHETLTEGATWKGPTAGSHLRNSNQSVAPSTASSLSPPLSSVPGLDHDGGKGSRGLPSAVDSAMSGVETRRRPRVL